MIAALIFANIVQAVAFAFSRTANKAIITEVVEKDEIVTYNARSRVSLAGCCCKVLLCSPSSFYNFASLHMTLVLDAISFSSHLH